MGALKCQFVLGTNPHWHLTCHILALVFDRDVERESLLNRDDARDVAPPELGVDGFILGYHEHLFVVLDVDWKRATLEFL